MRAVAQIIGIEGCLGKRSGERTVVRTSVVNVTEAQGSVAIGVQVQGDAVVGNQLRSFVVVHRHIETAGTVVASGIRYAESNGCRPNGEEGSAGQSGGLSGRQSPIAVVIGTDRVAETVPTYTGVVVDCGAARAAQCRWCEVIYIYIEGTG